ncbi:hypothetical protein AALP_AAs52045U000300 [Arabis alpina]|uniref:Uncharacterized protein n=1 Tax=Arabis alpina TaxID=50452 RepID=A0A087G164_ARAAL|nr:hypothetical protein AALP_AAs52045U000300 [Arabis alpina]
MTKTFESLSTSFTPKRNVSLDVNHETPPVSFDPSLSLTEIEASPSRFALVYANTSERTGSNPEASTPFVDTSDRTGVPHPSAPPLADLPFREYLNRIRAGNHRWDDLSSTRIRLARDRLDIWDSKYWAAEMRGVTPGIPAFNTLSTPIRPRKSRRLFEVSNSSGVGPWRIQRKGPGDVSRSKGKGKVDLVDKKAEKKRIAAKPKVDLEAGMIPAFRIGGICEVLPSEAPIAQSLGVTPHASLLVSSNSAAIPPCPTIQTAVNVPLLPPPRASLTPSSRPASELLSESSLLKIRHTTEVEVLQEEKQRVEDEVKERDINLEAASAEIAKLRANLEKSRFLEDHLRKERDGARCRADEIASGGSARSARHSSSLKRIRSYLVALHAQEDVKAQLYYWRGARISLEKMVEAEYELPHDLLQNYGKEEKENLAKVKSLTADSLGEGILFLTPPLPPAGPPQDVSSQVP